MLIGPIRMWSVNEHYITCIVFCYEYSTCDATFVYAHVSSSDGRLFLLNILKLFLAPLGLQKSLWFLVSTVHQHF